MADQNAFDEVAAELYGLPLTEFTAARTAAASQARQNGDAELAGRIGGLRKPTLVGWLANQLVRECPDEIRALVELGESLREAMRRPVGDQLRESAGQQQQVVYALVQQAYSLAETAGQTMSTQTRRGLEETLHAALVDPQVAAELKAGRLTGPMSRSGFPDLQDSERGQSAPSLGSQKRANPHTRRDKQRAGREAERTAQAHASAQHDVDQLEQAALAAKEQVELLRGQLDDAIDEQTRTEAELRKARRRTRETDQAARAAARRLAEL